MANQAYITTCLESGYLLMPAIVQRGQALQQLEEARSLLSELGDVQSSLSTACAGLRQVRDYLDRGFELRPIITGSTVAKIRQVHETKVFTPRSAEEAQNLIQENCGRVEVAERIQVGLKSLLSAYGTISSRFNAARMSIDQGRIVEAKGAIRDGISALLVSTRTPWLKTGQLLIALTVIAPDPTSNTPILPISFPPSPPGAATDVVLAQKQDPQPMAGGLFRLS